MVGGGLVGSRSSSLRANQAAHCAAPRVQPAMTTGLYDLAGDDAIVLRVHAQPGAGRSAVVGRFGDALKVKVAAPPQGGRANDALAVLLADEFGVKSAHVTLIGGASSRSKRFRIEGLELERVDALLDRILAAAGDGVDRRPGRAG